MQLDPLEFGPPRRSGWWRGRGFDRAPVSWWFKSVKMPSLLQAAK
ncbi:hypothetical protein [Micromonospora inyonensis]|nr:hypothetical protein [Micromonospora inyonensis]